MEGVVLDAGPVSLHGVRWSPPPGDEECQPPILLVHGLGGSSLEWGSVGGALAHDTSRRVIAIDLIGFGRTETRRSSCTVPAQRRMLARLLEDLGPAVVVGNSMGGLITVGLAAERPDLVAGLVLVDAALPAGGAGGAAIRGAMRFVVPLVPGIGPAVIGRRQRRAGAERHVSDRLAVIVHRSDRVDSELRARLVELAAWRIPRRHAHQAYASAARSIFIGARSGWQAVRRVQAPTLAVHGRRDVLVPPALVNRLRSVRPDWSYEVFEDAGHLPHLELPGEFVAVVGRWIREQIIPPG